MEPLDKELTNLEAMIPQEFLKEVMENLAEIWHENPLAQRNRSVN